MSNLLLEDDDDDDDPVGESRLAKNNVRKSIGSLIGKDVLDSVKIGNKKSITDGSGKSNVNGDDHLK